MERSSIRDLSTGLLFVLTGIIGILAAWDYPIGTMRRIGPGSFPLLVSGTLALIGLALVVKSLPAAIREPRPFGAIDIARTLWALLLVVGSLLAFSFLIRPLGLVFTTLICVVISYAGAVRILRTRGGIVEGAVVAVSIVAFVVLVFAYGIGLPIRLWP